MPALTVLGILLVNGPGRQKLLKAVFTRDAFLSILLLAAVVGAVLGLQALVLKEQWLPYLKSITIQGKYNAGYLGFGFNSSIILLLLITIFPWTPAFLAAIVGKGWSPKLKIHPRTLSFGKFCAIWFWSNFLFLLFFYKQTDFRTFTLLVPPLAVLAAIGLFKGQRGLKFSVNFLFLFIFAVAIGLLLVQPTNAQGIDLSSALLPISLFAFSLILLAWYFLRPSSFSFASSFTFICLAYVSLFWSALPLANAFNPDSCWPPIIRYQRSIGTEFYIYRPPDRDLFFSPDLFYVDFMAGPADRYFWSRAELRAALGENRALVLSDTKSWDKVGIKNARVLVQDSYSSLFLR
jgi:hypothetical protein